MADNCHRKRSKIDNSGTTSESSTNFRLALNPIQSQDIFLNWRGRQSALGC